MLWVYFQKQQITMYYLILFIVCTVVLLLVLNFVLTLPTKFKRMTMANSGKFNFFDKWKPVVIDRIIRDQLNNIDLFMSF